MTQEPEQIFLLNHSESQSQFSFDYRRNCTANSQENLENVKDFSNVCRTCAAVTEYIIPIFDGEGLQNKLAEKIHQHLPIKVSEQDSLPRVVCYQCASTLLAWHELVKCCLQADEALKTKQAVWAAEASVQEKPGTSDDATIKELDDPASQDEWRGVAHALVFHCAECGRYLPRRDLLAHMAGHASQLQPLPALPALTSPAPATTPPDEFSDHSDDVDNGFGSLPESVFEAIEDSQNAGPEDKPSVTAVADADKKVRKEGAWTRSCPTCGKRYSVASSYFYHMKHAHVSVEAERPHACESCGRGFKTRGALRAHAATHAAPALPCARCQRTFRTRAARLLHACAGAAPERWECARCGRVFSRRAPLLRHERRHAPRALHCTAPGCTRTFHVHADLARHARTHAPPARMQCPHATCAATFLQARYLRVHLANKHAGPAPPATHSTPT